MTAEGANHKHESEMNGISYKQGSSSLPRQPVGASVAAATAIGFACISAAHTSTQQARRRRVGLVGRERRGFAAREGELGLSSSSAISRNSAASSSNAGLA
jgi:hypothetical protein